MILETNNKTFDKIVLNANTPVLVDFYADWCAPCQRFAPVLEELAIELGTKAIITRINADENLDLAVKYNILTIPTVLVVISGKVIHNIGGVQTKRTLRKMLGL